MATPLKVPRPGGAAQALGELLHLHVSLVARGIHGRGLRGVEHVHARFPGQGRVPLQVPGIARQVLVGAELRRVDEEADHQPVAAGLAVLHQAQVPPVEKAHGGHQGDFQPWLAPLGGPGPASPWDR